MVLAGTDMKIGCNGVASRLGRIDDTRHTGARVGSGTSEVEPRNIWITIMGTEVSALRQLRRNREGRPMMGPKLPSKICRGKVAAGHDRLPQPRQVPLK